MNTNHDRTITLIIHKKIYKIYKYTILVPSQTENFYFEVQRGVLTKSHRSGT